MCWWVAVKTYMIKRIADDVKFLLDCTGAQIGNNDSERSVFLFIYFLDPLMKFHGSASDDIKNADLRKVHNLSGPIAVEGAEPGDCLVVDILDSEFYQQISFLIDVSLMSRSYSF
jgi:acetamidase/formamidase